MTEPTLVYDARCTLCTMWKEGVAASGWRSMRFADANDTAAARRLGVSNPDQLRRRMLLVRPDGSEAWGYDAAVELLALGPGGEGIATILSCRPIAKLGRWLYERVAASRSCATG
jgi:predicted DCC family thiol-disulfide oxidoreductase YuxK